MIQKLLPDFLVLTNRLCNIINSYTKYNVTIRSFKILFHVRGTNSLILFWDSVVIKKHVFVDTVIQYKLFNSKKILLNCDYKIKIFKWFM